MKSDNSVLHGLRNERGSAAYSFLGFAIVAVCIIAVIFVFPWNQIGGESPKDANYLSGMDALKQKQYNEAIAYFDKSIQANPNGAAFLGKAKADMALGNIDKALQDATAAIEKNAGAEAYGQRGVIYKIQDKTDQALKDFNEAIKKDSRYAWALAQRADLFNKQKNYEKALDDANRAVSAKKDFVEAYRLRGSILTRMGKCKEASADFIAVQKMKPDDPAAIQDTAWFLLTCPDEKLQDSAKAMELAKKAVDMSGGMNSAAQETLAEAYFRQGDALKAVEHQKKAIELGSQNCPDGSCVKDMQQRLQKYELAGRQEIRTGYEILPLNSSL
ncbi:tetratricopeptide repeat protein [Desulfomonile tiedjei]|uniref:Tetratricopeptide repeat protein n=1 Tax=Desulfomonile tiedjei (strain ATCC 49306 / DSM 6799 / DCB-1) TaxID=706587 RepID=I4C2V4_DESTA|nr:tetratricopeptide repeat protein [Desulfomonile tiedjei]AFM23895.1 tetratricopeptide repeat protein [Desulfomonile tiedjei DSM 6799]